MSRPTAAQLALPNALPVARARCSLSGVPLPTPRPTSHAAQTSRKIITTRAISVTRTPPPAQKERSADTPELVQMKVPLPNLTREAATAVLTEYGLKTLEKGASDVFTDTRPSTATVLFPVSLLKAAAAKVPVIIFAHGFTQPPSNYISTLVELATKTGKNAAGAIIIAPETGFCDSLKSVAGSGGARFGSPTNMQTALIVDVLRSAAFLKPSKGGPPAELQGLQPGLISLVGHSMGGGVSLVTAPYLKDVIGVAVEAPAVKQMSTSPVNPDIALSGLFGKGFDNARKFFLDIFPAQAKLHILGGDQDQIVPPLEVAQLFAAAREAVKAGKLKDVTLFRLKGAHIGFEDKVSLEFTNPLLTAVFAAINLLVYKKELLKPLLQDFSEQKAAAQQVLVGCIQENLGLQTYPPVERESDEGVYDLNYGTTAAKTRGALTEEELKSISFEADQLIDPDLSKQPASEWAPATALLLGYATAQVGTAAFTAKLPLDSYGSQPWGVSAGLATLAALSAGLVYENALLAGGRFIGQTPLLQSLSQYRYIAHAFAPALAFVTAEMAARAGVDWAGTLVTEGGIALALVAAIAGSFVESWFLLETKPMLKYGILSYGYKNPAFSKVVPVITATVLSAVVGVAAAKQDPSVWPLAAGPIAAFMLSAVPQSAAPTWLAGNFGEVLLLASLAASEVILRGQGL